MIWLQSLPGATTPQLLVAAAGFLAGAFARFVKQWYDKRTRRIKLRKAVLSEVQITEEVLEDAAEQTVDDVDPDSVTHTQFPSQVYEEHVDDIGLLCAPEVPRVVEYYNLLAIAEEQLDPDDGSPDVEAFVEETAPNLKRARDDADEALGKHNRWFGRYRYRLSQFRG